MDIFQELREAGAAHNNLPAVSAAQTVHKCRRRADQIEAGEALCVPFRGECFCHFFRFFTAAIVVGMDKRQCCQLHKGGFV